MPWPDVKGKRCLDVWTFDESLRFEMAGYRVTHLAWRPRLPRCIEGCRLWSGLAGLGGSPNVGICLTPSATRLSRHVRRSPSSSSIWRLDGSPPVRGWTSAHPGPLSSEGPSTAGWGNISNARSSPWIRLVRAQHYPGPSWRVRAGQCGLASNPTRDRRR
jgi:hypothetical protein